MRVSLLPRAARDLARLSPENSKRVEEAIDLLSDDPRPPGCKLLRDRKARTWRLRVGDFRLLYDINDTEGLPSAKGRFLQM